MPDHSLANRFLRIAIAAVWLINGLFCKVFNLVPRHQAIVAEILGPQHAAVLTKGIGGLEVLMCVWVLSRIRPKLCAMTQIAVVAVMNVIEYMMVPGLLLFGRLNIAVASLFIVVVALQSRFEKA